MDAGYLKWGGDKIYGIAIAYADPQSGSGTAAHSYDGSSCPELPAFTHPVQLRSIPLVHERHSHELHPVTLPFGSWS